MNKRKNRELYIPSFKRCWKAVLWIISISTVIGLFVAGYDWIVIAITGLFL